MRIAISRLLPPRPRYVIIAFSPSSRSFVSSFRLVFTNECVSSLVPPIVPPLVSPHVQPLVPQHTPRHTTRQHRTAHRYATTPRSHDTHTATPHHTASNPSTTHHLPPRPNDPPPDTPLSDTHDGTNTNRTTATTRQDETARKHELTKTAQQDNADTRTPIKKKRRKRDKNTGRETGRETRRPPQDEKTKRHRPASPRRETKRNDMLCHHRHANSTPLSSPYKPPRRADKNGATHDTPTCPPTDTRKRTSR